MVPPACLSAYCSELNLGWNRVNVFHYYTLVYLHPDVSYGVGFFISRENLLAYHDFKILLTMKG